MLKTDGFRILDAQNAATPEDKEKKASGMHNQNVVRRKLVDITNQPQNRKALIREKSQCIEITAKEYINQLQKENMALVKMLAQRNKIIEHNEIEIDRVKANMLTMQEQNQQLAISNAQMLVELNSGKDRLKMLQHELGCRTAILKERKLNLKGRETTTPFANADAEKLIKSQEEMESLKEEIHDEKLHETTRNLQHNGAYPSEQVQYKEETENKRLSLRRQSARFTVAEVKHVEDLFETNKTTVSAASQLPEDSVGEQGSTSVSAVVKNKDNTDDSGKQIGKSSMLRPSRAAAKKVQSYKEAPINVKLRRPE